MNVPNSGTQGWYVAARAAATLVLFLSLASVAAHAAVDLPTAIALAQERDPWVTGSEWRQQSLESRGTAAAALPDPFLHLGAANLPMDSFAFDQEPMTQLQFGLSQAIPRGATRELKRDQLMKLSEVEAARREERRAQVALTVTELWLDCYRANRTQAMIQADRRLFIQLKEVVASRYRTTLGVTRQQDIVRANLELTRLDDRVTRLSEQEALARARLGEWMGGAALTMEVTVPNQEVAEADLSLKNDMLAAARLLSSHPSIRSLDLRIAAMDVGVSLARERYKPGFTVNAGYGYRQASPDGVARPDFFSVGLAIDLPLFPDQRQDQQLRAAQADAEALRTERQLLLRELRTGLETTLSRLSHLNSRRQLYRTRLLSEMAQQAEVVRAAYRSDDGDFTEVIRAGIGELNARIDALELDIERQRMIARLDYYLAGRRGDKP